MKSTKAVIMSGLAAALFATGCATTAPQLPVSVAPDRIKVSDGIPSQLYEIPNKSAYIVLGKSVWHPSDHSGVVPENTTARSHNMRNALHEALSTQFKPVESDHERSPENAVYAIFPSMFPGYTNLNSSASEHLQVQRIPSWSRGMLSTNSAEITQSFRWDSTDNENANQVVDGIENDLNTFLQQKTRYLERKAK
jgi:hypothetical protein